MNVSRASLLALAVSALFAGAASAATDTDDFTVSITVENSCSITVDDMAFGTQNDLTASHTATADGAVTCTGTSPLSVTFNAGTGTGSTIGARNMSNASGEIAYNLYTDTTYTTILGDGTTGADIDMTGTGTFTVFGQTDAGQNPAEAGTYTSVVTATLTY